MGILVHQFGWDPGLSSSGLKCLYSHKVPTPPHPQTTGIYPPLVKKRRKKERASIRLNLWNKCEVKKNLYKHAFQPPPGTLDGCIASVSAYIFRNLKILRNSQEYVALKIKTGTYVISPSQFKKSVWLSHLLKVTLI